MPVPSTFSDLSTTPASNSPAGSDSPTVIDDHIRTLYAFIASVYTNTGNGWASPWLTSANPSYTGTLTGGSGAVNLGSGQLYKDASGNLGVGTASPATRLHVESTGAPAIRVASSTAGTPGASLQMIGATTAKNWAIGSNLINTGSLDFVPSTVVGGAVFSTAVMTLDASGNVGINRSAPSVKLDVDGALSLSAPIAVAGATYTVTTTDSCIRFTGSGCTLTLPAAASFSGRILRLLQSAGASAAVISASANVVPQGASSAGTAILSAAAGKWADLRSDGSVWWITASN